MIYYINNNNGLIMSIISGSSSQPSPSAPPTPLGNDALHQACRKGNLTKARQCLNQGLQLFDKDKENKTPLHDACERGNVEFVRSLLIYAQKDQEGFTPLHIACFCEDA